MSEQIAPEIPFPQDKIRVLRDYLQTNFPGQTVHCEYDYVNVMLKLRMERLGITQMIVIGEHFLDNRTAQQIESGLRQWDLAGALSKIGPALASLTHDRLQIKELREERIGERSETYSWIGNVSSGTNVPRQ